MEFGEYRLVHPLFLVLVLLVPLGLWYAKRRVRRGTVRFSSIVPFRSVRTTARVRFRFLVPLLRVLALVLLVVALARPQQGDELTPIQAEGIAIMIVMDASGSMRAEDFELDGRKAMRIDAVKSVIHDFVRGKGSLPGRPNDQIGLISFTGYPVPRAPLTLDHGAVLDVLKSVEAPDPKKVEKNRFGQALYPEDFQTGIGDALAKGAERLRDIEATSKVMILLSDGANNYGHLKPSEAATIAKSFDIKVYTIGIGQSGVIMEKVMSLFGPMMRPRQSDLDEATLEAIAAATGGKYYNAASTDALKEVYEEIDALEKTEIISERFYRWDEKFQGWALAALGLLVAEVLLGQTLFRRLP